jgi:TatD DNase family protein
MIECSYKLYISNLKIALAFIFLATCLFKLNILSTADPIPKNFSLTETHAHLFSEEFRNDRDDMIRRAVDAGIEKMVMPNVDHETIDAMLEVESKYPKLCFATMGLHPCSVKKDFQRELYVVEDWLSKRKFTAVGEMGTDLYWDKTFWEEQKEAFRIQAAWAKKYSLPLIIHCRETIDETIGLVEELQDGKLTGVFHCFTGNVAQAEKIIKLNFFLGIGGVSTFKKGGLDIVLPDIPISNIVLETDSPYLAPVPHRGKRNEPAYVALIASRISELKKISTEEVHRETTANAMRLFPSLNI